MQRFGLKPIEMFILGVLMGSTFAMAVHLLVGP